MTVTIETPRAPRGVRRRGINWEKWGWIYMRLSGVVLVVLIFGHLFVNLMLGEGVKGLDFGFVAGKLTNPFWQTWDVLLLWLALIHGANGMRTITNDYAHNRLVGVILKVAILVSTIVLLILGTLVIYTFDPCPVGAPADLIASFCSGV